MPCRHLLSVASAPRAALAALTDALARVLRATAATATENTLLATSPILNPRTPLANFGDGGGGCGLYARAAKARWHPLREWKTPYARGRGHDVNLPEVMTSSRNLGDIPSFACGSPFMLKREDPVHPSPTRLSCAFFFARRTGSRQRPRPAKASRSWITHLPITLVRDVK